MKQVGVRKICDRCGKSIFIANNDHSTLDDFVELKVFVKTRNGYGDDEETFDLCSDCLSKFENMLYRDFLEN